MISVQLPLIQFYFHVLYFTSTLPNAYFKNRLFSSNNEKTMVRNVNIRDQYNDSLLRVWNGDIPPRAKYFRSWTRFTG